MKRIYGALMVICLILLETGCKGRKYFINNVEEKFQDNMCVDYFYDLNTEYPTNLYGSCGYVAIATLLEYYDYAYDNNIVDSKYENGNTLKYANVDDIKDMDATDYYNYLESTYDEYLQSYLIVEVNRKYGIYNFKSNNPALLGWGSYCDIPGYYCEAQGILDYYLQSLNGFDNITAYKPNYDARNILTNKLLNGIPIIASGQDENDNEHIFIIYDYDNINDKFYGNSLTKEGYNHFDVFDRYESLSYIIYLDYQEKTKEQVK